MKALIIEDKLPDFKRIRFLFELQFPEIKIKGPLTSVNQVRSYFATAPKLDFILAGIKLVDGTVFEAFSSLKMKIPVIFVTACKELALGAFKYNGLDYLLKPVDIDEFTSAVTKILTRNEGSQQESLATLPTRDTAKYRKRFLCPYKDGFVICRTTEVSHISLDFGIVKLHLMQGDSHPIDLTMDELEAQLEPEMFFRANRQHIIQINSIHRLINYWNRRIKVELAGFPEVEVIVSKEKSAELKKWLDK